VKKLFAAVVVLIALIVLDTQVGRSQILADVLTLKSGERVEGRITAESDLSVTISAETSTGNAERMISRSEISGITRSEPLAPVQTPSADSSEPPDRSSVSPDKKWEYKAPNENEGPRIVKAGTNEMGGDLSDACGIGTCGGYPRLVWAPDSKWLAFYWGQGRTHQTALYQFNGEKWIALKVPGEDDEIWRRANALVASQLKSEALSKKTSLRFLWWTVEPDRWSDPGRLVVHASLAERLESKELGFGGDFLFTLKFDGAGKWKVVKAHKMSEKEVEKREKGQ